MIRPSRQIPRLPVQSPLDLSVLFAEAQRIQSLRAKMEQDHEEHMAKVSSALEKVDAAISYAKTIQKGEPGMTPVKGVHYFDGAPGPAGRDGETPTINHKELARQLLPLLPKVKDGKDGKAPTIDDILKAVKEKLTVEHIPGLKNEIASYRNQLAGKIYGKDTMARGGGDTVTAGTGITISTDANGKKVITNSASGAGTTVYGEDLSSQAPGTSFTLAHTPIAGSVRLYRGGSRQNGGAGNDYTISGATITFNTSVASGEIIIAEYVY